jgi:hypothetical protein
MRLESGSEESEGEKGGRTVVMIRKIAKSRERRREVSWSIPTMIPLSINTAGFQGRVSYAVRREEEGTDREDRNLTESRRSPARSRRRPSPHQASASR